MQQVMTPVRLRLKEARESKGWNQTELAQRSGVLQGTISKIEKGTGGIDFDILDKLATALGVNAALLIVHDTAPVTPEPALIPKKGKRRKK